MASQPVPDPVDHATDEPTRLSRRAAVGKDPEGSAAHLEPEVVEPA